MINPINFGKGKHSHQGVSMTLPVFESDMFDFGTYDVPEHIDDDTEWFMPVKGTWSVLYGQDPVEGNEIACWVPTQQLAELLAQAFCRKDSLFAHFVWTGNPDGTFTRVKSDVDVFNSLGSENEAKLASSYRTP